MTHRAFTAALSLLLTSAIAPSAPHAQTPTRDPEYRIAQQGPGGPAANQGEDKEGDNTRPGKRTPGKEGPGRGERGPGREGGGPGREGGPPPQRQGQGQPQGQPAGKPDKTIDRAQGEALKQKQLEAQQAREKAVKQKQDADLARENAIKQQQLDAQKAKENAAPPKRPIDRIRERVMQGKEQNAVQPRDNAATRRQDADRERDNVLRLQQLDAQQERDKALKQKQDADLARENAIKQKQIDDQRARENAAPPPKRDIDRIREGIIKKKEMEAGRGSPNRDADLARENEIRQQQLDAQRRRDGDRGPSKFDRAKADQEYQRARQQAERDRQGGGDRGRGGPGDTERWREGSASKFEALRKGRRERVDLGGARNVIVEPDKRVIVRENNRAFIRHDETRRFAKSGRELRRERRKDGTLLTVYMGLAGALIYTLEDEQGRLLRRSRKDRDGREIVLIDNRNFYHDRRGSQFGPGRYYDSYVDLPPPDVRIPRDKYIVDYDDASEEDIYDALSAPPIERLDRGYSLDEVRHSYRVLERMRRVDLDAINFDFGSWDVGEDQYRKLERIADAMRRILDKSPDEVFLIEGHTDAVGSDIDNLSLSDRRAETVAVILTETFDIPPENLTTQGYGEQYLKVMTDGPSRINRRVSVRRITPLLSRRGWDEN